MSVDTDYWRGQLDYYKANQPPKMESHYNKDFATKVAEARANIDNLVAEKDRSYAATGQAQDDYKAFQGTMSTYNEVYTQSKSEFGIEQHYDNYEKSKKALALAESTLSALPSSINASSNQVLSQAQRERRYNILSDRYMLYRDNTAKGVSEYEKAWKNARESQSAYTQAEIASQWGKLGEYNNAWLRSLEAYSNAEKKLTEGRDELRRWESQYRDWQYRQWQYENTIWLKNYESAMNRYFEALDTENVMREAERIKAKSDRDARSAYNAEQVANAKDRLAQSLVNLHWVQQNNR